jgi:CubicO group peptidase (beta-lactamase class C family)
MKYNLLFLILFTCATFCFSQEKYKISYEKLKEYDGLYEYVNNGTIRMGASPKDTLLFAIINESKYKLKAIEKDIFLNMSGERVTFYRNKSQEIAGYITEKDSFKLKNKVSYSKSTWFPRLDKNTTVQTPINLKDGLKVGTIEKSELNPKLITDMMTKIIDGTYPNVHSVLIIKDNKLVLEEYFYEYNKDSLHELRSATKSFFSALTGIAIDKKIIKSTNEKVLSFFPEYDFENNSDLKRQLTIENLLTNESGLDCDASNPKTLGNETKMNNSDDWIKFTLDLPMVANPGENGMYCSGNPIAVGKIVEKESKTKLADFAKENLFEPLGIKKFKWNFKPDKSSVETFCQLYLRPRDMAKFGLLYLNNGKWKEKQIVSEYFVKQSLSKHSVIQGVDYGYLWWIKYFDADGTRYYGKGAQGNGGQRIYLFEKQNIVVVITAGNYNSQSSSDEIIKKNILPAFNKKP